MDASRAVGVVGSLINPELKPEFVGNIRAEYEKVRAQHGAQKAKPLLKIEEARRRRTAIAWQSNDLPRPEFTGLRVVTTEAQSPLTGSSDTLPIDLITLSDLDPFIDWSPFFHTWELRGRYPAILENAEARKLFEDAQKLLREIVARKLLAAKAVYGFFPANAIGDDLELYVGQSRKEVLTTFHFLRQQMDKGPGQSNYCLADFIAPKSLRFEDYVGAFAVTAGFGVEDLCRKFEQDHDDYNSIMTKALADRLAEAFAEYLHQRVRQAWGYGKTEELTVDELIREKYRGIRPAAGYPACPDHTEKWTLWKLLEVEKNTGIKLTESCAMWPGASVSGLYFAHREARYFAVGKLGQDQVLDYGLRKAMTVEEVERWLGPYLAYEPDQTPIGSSGSASPGKSPSTPVTTFG